MSSVNTSESFRSFTDGERPLATLRACGLVLTSLPFAVFRAPQTALRVTSRKEEKT